MIFFKSFCRKGRISKQLSPRDPLKCLGALGVSPGGQPGGISQEGVSQGGQPGGSAGGQLGGQPGGQPWFSLGISPGV